MKKRLSSILAIGLIASANSALSATSIGLVTFDTATEGFFSFAQNAASIATIYPATGVGGTAGISTSVSADPGTFAGGGLGDAGNNQFDLSIAGISPGAVTLADIDNIVGSVDVNLPVGQQIAIRLEPGNGGFNERLELGVTIDGTGAFQNISFDAASAPDASQKTTFINTLNGGSVTNLKFIFQINNQAGAVGSDFTFDNIGLEVIPEPSTSASLLLGGVLVLLRRRRN